MLDVASIWTTHVQQQNYRALLEAMSRPGLISPVDTGDNDKSYLAVLATLLDGEISLTDMHQLLDEKDWPLLQANYDNTDDADYLLCRGDKPSSLKPRLGSLSSPEDSATLIICIGSLSRGDLHLRMSGPGINGSSHIAVDGLHSSWLTQREDWICAFPLGVDMILVDQAAVMAIPRTTRVEIV